MCLWCKLGLSWEYSGQRFSKDVTSVEERGNPYQKKNSRIHTTTKTVRERRKCKECGREQRLVAVKLQDGSLMRTEYVDTKKEK